MHLANCLSLSSCCFQKLLALDYLVRTLKNPLSLVHLQELKKLLHFGFRPSSETSLIVSSCGANKSSMDLDCVASWQYSELQSASMQKSKWQKTLHSACRCSLSIDNWPGSKSILGLPVCTSSAGQHLLHPLPNCFAEASIASNPLCLSTSILKTSSRVCHDKHSCWRRSCAKPLDPPKKKEPTCNSFQASHRCLK